MMTTRLSPDVEDSAIPALTEGQVNRLCELAVEWSDPYRMLQAAAQLAELGRDRGYARQRLAKPLAEFVLNVVGADVAFLREREGDDTLLLLGNQEDVAWGQGVAPIGAVPIKKWCEDGPCRDLSQVSGGNREPEHEASSRNRNEYSDEARAFMRWLGSEAWIPIKFAEHTLAVLLVGKSDRFFFTETRLRKLRQIQGFVQAFYHIAAATDDRIENVRILRHVAAVLPRFAEAPSHIAFWRAVCALITCRFGFKLNRAVLFWLHHHCYPAVAKMAVGGLGDQNRGNWREAYAEIGFDSLGAYIGNAFDKAEPAGDPLYELIKGGTVTLDKTRDAGSRIFALLSGKLPVGEVLRLGNDDPWVSRIRAEHPGVFASKHGEYFVFPLVPPSAKGQRTPFGFVVADLAYEPRKHVPGPDNPNLGIVELVVQLIAGIWQARENSESYLHVLAALPALRHDAPALDLPVEWIAHEVLKDHGHWNVEQFRKQANELQERSCRLREAADIVEKMRFDEGSESVPRISEWLARKAREFQGRYAEKLCCQVIPEGSEYNDGVRIGEHFLDSILTCIVDNAVEACTHPPVKVTMCARLTEVPEGTTQKGHRVVLEIANDGPEIPKGLGPYVFVTRVSTHDPNTKHRGSGLSSARLLAQAHGGDVVLFSENPVRFGIVLHVAA
jgi:hypothetical protein